jgi:rRNA maturation RNase YbeY
MELELDVIVNVALPPEIVPHVLDELVSFILQAEDASGTWNIAVVLTDDEHLRTLHRDFMGIDTVTDVMTFPVTDPGSEVNMGAGGDIIVSVDRAAFQGTDFGNSVAEEVCFLVVHGLLHLCGWNDSTDAERSLMLDRQRQLIVEFERRSRTS